MKRKILVLSLAIIAFSIADSMLTLSYFTDSDSSTASFTVGRVKIRTIAASIGRYTADSQYSDAEILQDASKYADYLNEKCTNLFSDVDKPAKCMRNIFVQNTGTVPVYVRVRVQIPRDAYLDDVDIELGGSKEYEVSESSGFVTCFADASKRCHEYVFTRLQPLAAGAMTTNPSMTAMTYSGIAQVSTEDGEEGSSEGVNLTNMGIKVYAQAIQAQGFSSATEAFSNYQ